MGLKGSKSMLTRFSLPSSVRMVPVYTTRPLVGTCTLLPRFLPAVSSFLPSHTQVDLVPQVEHVGACNKLLVAPMPRFRLAP